MNKIKVLVTDSSPIYALGLFKSLSEDKRIEVFNHVYNGRHLLDVMRQITPDIILIDSGLLDHDGITFFEMLQKLHPEVKIVVLVPPEDIISVLDNVLNAGAKGLLPKTISPTELVNSIIKTDEVGAYIHPTFLPQIMEKLALKIKEKPEEDHLSFRETEVIKLVAEGKSNREIAEVLFLSNNTVKIHIKGIMRKIKVNNRVEVARYALFNKFI